MRLVIVSELSIELEMKVSTNSKIKYYVFLDIYNYTKDFDAAF